MNFTNKTRLQTRKFEFEKLIWTQEKNHDGGESNDEYKEIWGENPTKRPLPLGLAMQGSDKGSRE